MRKWLDRAQVIVTTAYLAAIFPMAVWTKFYFWQGILVGLLLFVIAIVDWVIDDEIIFTSEGVELTTQVFILNLAYILLLLALPINALAIGKSAAPTWSLPLMLVGICVFDGLLCVKYLKSSKTTIKRRSFRAFIIGDVIGAVLYSAIATFGNPSTLDNICTWLICLWGTFLIESIIAFVAVMWAARE